MGDRNATKAIGKSLGKKKKKNGRGFECISRVVGNLENSSTANQTRNKGNGPNNKPTENDKKGFKLQSLLSDNCERKKKLMMITKDK